MPISDYTDTSYSSLPSGTASLNYSDLSPEQRRNDPEYLSDVASFMSDRGKQFSDDEEMLDAFYSEKRWDDLNTIGLIGDAFGQDESTKLRDSNLQKSFAKDPAFYEAGGRGTGDAIIDIGKALIVDPINLLGFGAVKAGTTALTLATKLIVKEAGETVARQGLTGTARDAAIKEIVDVGIKDASKKAVWSAARKGFAYEGGLNAAIGAVHNGMMQTRDIELGLRSEYSGTEMAVAGAVGLGIGGAMGSTIGGVGTKLIGQKGAYKTLAEETSQRSAAALTDLSDVPSTRALDSELSPIEAAARQAADEAVPSAMSPDEAISASRAAVAEENPDLETLTRTLVDEEAGVAATRIADEPQTSASFVEDVTPVVPVRVKVDTSAIDERLSRPEVQGEESGKMAKQLNEEKAAAQTIERRVEKAQSELAESRAKDDPDAEYKALVKVGELEAEQARLSNLEAVAAKIVGEEPTVKPNVTESGTTSADSPDTPNQTPDTNESVASSASQDPSTTARIESPEVLEARELLNQDVPVQVLHDAGLVPSLMESDGVTPKLIKTGKNKGQPILVENAKNLSGANVRAVIKDALERQKKYAYPDTEEGIAQRTADFQMMTMAKAALSRIDPKAKVQAITKPRQKVLDEVQSVLDAEVERTRVAYPDTVNPNVTPETPVAATPSVATISNAPDEASAAVATAQVVEEIAEEVAPVPKQKRESPLAASQRREIEALEDKLTSMPNKAENFTAFVGETLKIDGEHANLIMGPITRTYSSQRERVVAAYAAMARYNFIDDAVQDFSIRAKGEGTYDQLAAFVFGQLGTPDSIDHTILKVVTARRMVDEEFGGVSATGTTPFIPLATPMTDAWSSRVGGTIDNASNTAPAPANRTIGGLTSTTTNKLQKPSDKAVEKAGGTRDPALSQDDLINIAENSSEGIARSMDADFLPIGFANKSIDGAFISKHMVDGDFNLDTLIPELVDIAQIQTSRRARLDVARIMELNKAMQKFAGGDVDLNYAGESVWNQLGQGGAPSIVRIGDDTGFKVRRARDEIINAEEYALAKAEHRALRRAHGYSMDDKVSVAPIKLKNKDKAKVISVFKTLLKEVEDESLTLAEARLRVEKELGISIDPDKRIGSQVGNVLNDLFDSYSVAMARRESEGSISGSNQWFETFGMNADKYIADHKGQIETLVEKIGRDNYTSEFSRSLDVKELFDLRMKSRQRGKISKAMSTLDADYSTAIQMGHADYAPVKVRLSPRSAKSAYRQLASKWNEMKYSLDPDTQDPMGGLMRARGGKPVPVPYGRLVTSVLRSGSGGGTIAPSYRSSLGLGNVMFGAQDTGVNFPMLKKEFEYNPGLREGELAKPSDTIKAHTENLSIIFNDINDLFVKNQISVSDKANEAMNALVERLDRGIVTSKEVNSVVTILNRMRKKFTGKNRNEAFKLIDETIWGSEKQDTNGLFGTLRAIMNDLKTREDARVPNMPDTTRFAVQNFAEQFDAYPSVQEARKTNPELFKSDDPQKIVEEAFNAMVAGTIEPRVARGMFALASQSVPEAPPGVLKMVDAYRTGNAIDGIIDADLPPIARDMRALAVEEHGIDDGLMGEISQFYARDINTKADLWDAWDMMNTEMEMGNSQANLNLQTADDFDQFISVMERMSDYLPERKLHNWERRESIDRLNGIMNDKWQNKPFSLNKDNREGASIKTFMRQVMLAMRGTEGPRVFSKAAGAKFVEDAGGSRAQVLDVRNGDSSFIQPYATATKGDKTVRAAFGNQINLGLNQRDFAEAVHEISHWAFTNLMTPSEQVGFLKSVRSHVFDGDQFQPSRLDELFHLDVPEGQAITGKNRISEVFGHTMERWILSEGINSEGRFSNPFDTPKTLGGKDTPEKMAENQTILTGIKDFIGKVMTRLHSTLKKLWGDELVDLPDEMTSIFERLFPDQRFQSLSEQFPGYQSMVLAKGKTSAEATRSTSIRTLANKITEIDMAYAGLNDAMRMLSREATADGVGTSSMDALDPQFRREVTKQITALKAKRKTFVRKKGAADADTAAENLAKIDAQIDELYSQQRLLPKSFGIAGQMQAANSVLTHLGGKTAKVPGFTQGASIRGDAFQPAAKDLDADTGGAQVSADDMATPIDDLEGYGTQGANDPSMHQEAIHNSTLILERLMELRSPLIRDMEKVYRNEGLKRTQKSSTQKVADRKVRAKMAEGTSTKTSSLDTLSPEQRELISSMAHRDPAKTAQLKNEALNVFANGGQASTHRALRSEIRKGAGAAPLRSSVPASILAQTFTKHVEGMSDTAISSATLFTNNAPIPKFSSNGGGVSQTGTYGEGTLVTTAPKTRAEPPVSDNPVAANLQARRQMLTGMSRQGEDVTDELRAVDAILEDEYGIVSGDSVTPVFVRSDSMLDVRSPGGSETWRAALEATEGDPQQAQSVIKAMGFDSMNTEDGVLIFNKDNVKSVFEFNEKHDPAMDDIKIDDDSMESPITPMILAALNSRGKMNIEELSSMADGISQTGTLTAGMDAVRHASDAAKGNVILNAFSLKAPGKYMSQKFQANWFANTIGGRMEKGVTGTGIFDAIPQRTASYWFPVEESLNKTKGRDSMLRRWKQDTVGQFVDNQPPVDAVINNVARLRQAIVAERRMGVLDVSPIERQIDAEINSLPAADRIHATEAVNALRNSMDKIMADQKAAGMHTGYLNEFYPQALDSNKADPYRNQLIDFFTRKFERERKISKGSPEAILRSKQDAQYMVDGMLDGDGQWLPRHADQNSSGAGELSSHARVLHYTMADLQTEMAPGVSFQSLLHNNLEQNMLKYMNGAARQIELHTRFGPGEHKYREYHEIAQWGEQAITDILAKGKTTTRTVGQQTAEGIGKVDLNFVDIQGMNVGQAQRVANNIRIAYENARGDADGGYGAVYSMVLSETRSVTPAIKRRAEAIAEGYRDFGNMIHMSGEGAKPTHADLTYMDNMMRLTQGKPTADTKSALWKVSKGMRNWNNITKLGGLLLTSLNDVTLPLIRSGSMKNYVAGIKMLHSSPEYSAMLKRIGVDVENRIHSQMLAMNGGEDSKLGNAFFSSIGMTNWTGGQRRMAGAIGFEMVKTMAQIHRKGTAGRRELNNAREELIHLGLLVRNDDGTFSGRAARDSIDDFKDDPEVASAVHRFIQETNFAPAPNELPLSQKTALGAILWQFKSFPLMYGRLMGETIKGASKWMKGEGGSIAPLLYLLSASPAFGGGTIALKDVLLSRGGDDNSSHALRERSLSKMFETLGIDVDMGEFANGNIDTALGWYLQGMMQAGGLGLIGDLLLSLPAWADNGAYGAQRMMGAVFGPSMGLVVDATNVLQGVMDREDSNAAERTAMNAIAGQIPYAASYRPFRNAMKDLAGESGSSSGGGGLSGLSGLKGL